MKVLQRTNVGGALPGASCSRRRRNARYSRPAPRTPYLIMLPSAAFTSALAERYWIDREIGRGGMATVYLARDVRHDRLVAVKVLSPELAASVGAERFLAEIQLTAKLGHPNILPVFDSGEASGTLYYVMPYVAGESLGARLAREGPLPVSETVHIASGIAA